MDTYVHTKSQKRYIKAKRWFDLVFALILLILSFPVMVIVSMFIALESKGPVIYRQRRPGRFQKIFTIYKFRTMKVEMTANGKALSDEERVTKLGRFLRKTSIDELPQVFNIIKGDMSFIGPRPFLINDLGTYSEEQMIRFMVLPGITSWTAIHGRNRLSVQEKYDLEIFYVKNISLKIDARIFFKTIVLVLSQKDIDNPVNQHRTASSIMDDTWD